MAFDPVTGLPIADPPPAQPPQTVSNALPPQQQPIVVQLPQQPPAPTAPVLTDELKAYFDQERERVRQEEKNKLYPQIDELQTTVKTLADAETARQAELDTQAQAAAEAERLRQEAEMTAVERVQQIERDMDARLKAAEEERDRERVLRQREAELGQLLTYRATRVGQESDNIMPELVDFVRGNTQEEIDASIEDVKARTASVLAQVQQQQVGNRQQLAMPVSSGPALEPNAMAGGDGGQRALTAEDIRNMSMEDYNLYRPQLLAASGQRVAQNGLYAP